MKTEKDMQYGAEVRDYYMVVGYWKDYLVTENEEGRLYVREEKEQNRDIGTFCESSLMFIPADFLQPHIYLMFMREFEQARGGSANGI